MNNTCFAYKKNKCNILTLKGCQGYNQCPFYKTQEECHESLRKSHERLSSLDKFKQQTIADQYYKGTYPWLKEER